jgi:hypothetical protein
MQFTYIYGTRTSLINLTWINCFFLERLALALSYWQVGYGSVFW